MALLLSLLLGVGFSFQLFHPVYVKKDDAPVTCAHFECEDDLDSSAELMNICIQYSPTSDTYYLTPCHHPDRWENHCSPTTDVSKMPVTCKQPEMEYLNLYPGEGPCSSNDGCTSGTCTNKICAGSNLGDSCSTNQDCNPGYFCSSGNCVYLLRPGQAGCMKDTECVNVAGCNKDPNNEAAGTCVEYFSLKSGDVVQNCINNTSMLCETGQCLQAGLIYKCSEALESDNSLPHKCKSSQDCSATFNSNKYYTDCKCGYNEAGNSYCQPFLGDNEGEEYVKNLKEWVKSLSMLSCHTERRFDWHCSMDWKTEQFDDLSYRNITYTQYTLIQDNPKCVKKIFTSDYNDAHDFYEDDDFSGIKWSLIGVFLGLI